MAVVDDLGRPGTDAPSEDYGRQPPQDLAAEQSVLGGMLLSKDAIADVLEKLRPSDFYRPAHQNIYDAILDLYGRGEPADAVTVAAELDRHTSDVCASTLLPLVAPRFGIRMSFHRRPSSISRRNRLTSMS